MNKTKFALIIVAIIFSFVYMIANIYWAVLYFIYAYLEPINVYLGIYQLLGGIANGVAAGFLIYAIAGNGKYFRSRHSFYMTAVVLTMAFSLFSIPSILLIITFFISDWVWIKHIDIPKEEKQEHIFEKEREEKIATLRKLKEEGKITEEEFNEQLFKLL